MKTKTRAARRRVRVFSEPPPLWRFVSLSLLLLPTTCSVRAWNTNNSGLRKRIVDPIRVGYARRIKADPSFLSKSIAEVFLAAGTQLSAEWTRRGSARMVPEIDFVVSGVLTAVAGKYYTMWRVAPTLQQEKKNEDIREKAKEKEQASDKEETRLGNMVVPTNAFQRTLSDGVTRPTLQQRVGSMIAPMVPLFRAGVIAGMIGYGLTALLITLRSICLPNYVPATQNINVLYASLYTGGFMAIVSNLRYQVLQGLVEPTIDRVFRSLPSVRGLLILACRWANGLLGSILAIGGMKALGLQRLK